MKKAILVFVSLIAMLSTLTMLNWIPDVVAKFKNHSMDSLLLLVPDLRSDALLIEAWKNTALEEGLHLVVQTDNEFLLPINQEHINYKGIILPDTVHARMSKTLAENLRSYVKAGGQLMLVFDAGTQNIQGHPYHQGSLFSPMLHFQYGALTEQGELSIAEDPVGQTKTRLYDLGVPPGKCIVSENSKVSIPNDYFCAISSYGYGQLAYQHFITKPIKNNIPLLLTTTDHQFIAGERPYGNGHVLFINLPLTSLWRSTDSMLLHTFLHYFAIDMIGLPSLATVPNGVGGVIMNLHVESKDALPALSILKEIGLFQQGPYSIDFTGGPDLDHKGDKKGLDVLNTLRAQHWITYLAKLGNAIGSDGGWMHNYYGSIVDETNQSRFQDYITINNQVLEKILGQKILEYVPSMGNQPIWATRYIEQQGFLGYYSTSNTGASPTKNFRNGVFDSEDIWSFPCLPLGAYASLRDFGFANLSEEVVQNWLIESSHFVTVNHTSRLIYFHPTDILYFSQYLDSLKAWLGKTKELINTGDFQWYSMVGMAEFLNARKKVYWKVDNTLDFQIITASHEKSLAQQTWLVAKNNCKKPTITVGTGDIRDDEDNWIITAGNIKTFQFQCKPIVG